jgi:hypothetical protein
MALAQQRAARAATAKNAAARPCIRLVMGPVRCPRNAMAAAPLSRKHLRGEKLPETLKISDSSKLMYAINLSRRDLTPGFAGADGDLQCKQWQLWLRTEQQCRQQRVSVLLKGSCCQGF